MNNRIFHMNNGYLYYSAGIASNLTMNDYSFNFEYEYL